MLAYKDIQDLNNNLELKKWDYLIRFLEPIARGK